MVSPVQVADPKYGGSLSIYSLGHHGSLSIKGAGMANIDVFEAIQTLRGVRRYRVDPVPEAAIRTILEAGTRGPSAINQQPWRFIAVTGAGCKTVATHYQKAWLMNRQDGTTANSATRGDPKILAEAEEFATKGIHDVPVFIIVCLTRANALDSVLQGVQLMMLAARALELGTLFTTLHRRVENEIKTHLGIPDGIEVPCIIPVGYPVKPFGPTSRLPLEKVAYRNRWGEPYS